MNDFKFRGDVQQAILLPPTGAAQDGLRVVAIDIYEDGIGVRWAAPTPPRLATREDLESDSHHAAFPDIKLADDVGTNYLHLEGGTEWSDEAMRGATIFGPPLSPHARRLTVRAKGREFEFDLSQALRRG